MRRKFTSEAALASKVVQWLRDADWTVYQEVLCGGSVCDIVAERGRLTWAIETKLAFGTAVVEQALHWCHRANLVSVATPQGRRWPRVLDMFCRWKGIGWLTVSPGEFSAPYERIDARLMRVTHRPLAKALRPEQLSGVSAGSTGGGYHTPFKETCKRVAEFVGAHPGVTLKELLEGVDTHYGSKASARSGIAHWAEKGKISGVRLERDGKALRLFPTEGRAA